MWLIQEHNKSIDELVVVLMKILDNTQKYAEDKARGFSSNKNKKDKQLIVSYDEGEDEKKNLS